MKRASYIEAVAKFIGVPVGEVRAHIRRLKRRAEGPESIPSVVRYATIKAGPIPDIEQPAAIQEGARPEAAEPEPANRWELNNLYDKWVAAASPDERTAVLKDIRREAKKLGSAVGWIELYGSNPDFASEVAAAVVNKIAAFQRENNSKFSTYAYGIGKKKALERKRKFARDRKRSKRYEDYLREKDRANDPWSSANARLLKADLLKGLNDEKRVLLDLMCDGRNPIEIAKILDITQDAAESRVRRLRETLRKKI